MAETATTLELEDQFSFFRTHARDVRFSYSKPDDGWLRRFVVQGIEHFTGQPKLQKLYLEWAERPVAGENIFAAAMRLMRVRLDCNETALARAPKTGPLLIVANHPFGVIDGLAMMDLATKLRPDVKIMVHSLLCQAPELKDYLLPVDFSGTKKAKFTTAITRRLAMEWLNDGHCLVIFPGGGVSTAQNPFFGTATDPVWHSFVARLTQVMGLKILPVFFEGQNSRWFQLASHISYNLRLALLFRESAKRMGGGITARIGEVIAASDIANADSKTLQMKSLRRATYALGGQDGEKEYNWPKYVKVD